MSSRCLDFSCPFSHSPILHGWLKAIYLGVATLPQIGWKFFHSSTNKSTKISSFFLRGNFQTDSNIFVSSIPKRGRTPESRNPRLGQGLGCHLTGIRICQGYCTRRAIDITTIAHDLTWNLETFPHPFFLFGRGYTRRWGVNSDGCFWEIALVKDIDIQWSKGWFYLGVKLGSIDLCMGYQGI